MEITILKKKAKILLATVITLIILTVVGFVSAGMYFYNVAVVPSHKTFLSNDKIKKNSPLYEVPSGTTTSKKFTGPKSLRPVT